MRGPRTVAVCLAALALGQAAALGREASRPEPLARCGQDLVVAPRGLDAEVAVPSDLTVGERVRGTVVVVNRTDRTVEVQHLAAVLLAPAGSVPAVPPGPTRTVARRLEPGQFVRQDLDLTLAACGVELGPGFYEVAVVLRLVDPRDGRASGVVVTGRRAVVLRR